MKKVLLLLLLLNACSPKQRFDRITKNHPELITTINTTVRDTIIHSDTVISSVYKDSFTITHDTTIVTKHFIITKKGTQFGVQNIPDTIIVNDTLYKTITIPARVIYKNKVDNLGLALSLSGVALLVIFLMFVISRLRT